MIEPYMLDIGLELLKILGGVLVPVMTILITIYGNKFSKRIKQGAVKGEINHLVRSSMEVKTFQKLTMVEKKEIILESILQFIDENNIRMTEGEIQIMIDRSLQSIVKMELNYKKLVAFKELQNE